MGRRGIAYLVLWLTMMVVRQDFWFHDDPEPIAGLLPAGLAYQVGFSLLAAFVMWCLVRFDWPEHLDRSECASDEDGLRPPPPEIEAS